MNNNNETFSYINNYIDLSTSEYNNYNTFINQNFTYNTLNANNLHKNKYIYNLKNHFNTPKYSRNFLKGNFIYNQRKVMSLHKSLNKRRIKRRETFDFEKINKSINLMHKNALKDKLLHNKIYKLIEKTAQDNYLKEKRKKNTFITTIEEGNLSNEKINLKNNINKEIKKPKKNVKIFLDPTINNNSEPEKIITPKKEKNHLTLSHIDSNKNNLNILNLTDIPLPCIKFNNSLNSLNINPNHRNSVAQTSLAKLKIEVIKNELNETLKEFFEKRDFPVGLTNETFNSYLKQQQYFFAFDDLNKKYMQFLANEIKDNIIFLGKLIEDKTQLLKENNEKLKKISALEEQIKIFESFNDLYLNLKNKSEKLKPPSQIKSPNRPRISYQKKPTFVSKRISLFKRGKDLFKRRETQIKVLIRNNINKKSMIESPKKGRELFKNTQELREIFDERERNVFLAYKKYTDVLYDESQLSIEKEKQKENKSLEINETNEIIAQLKKELIFLKIKNKELIEYKNSLINKKVNEENNNDNKNKNKNVSKILLKAKKILLNLQINLEKFLKIKNLYEIIKEKDLTRNIIFNGENYSKELFFIKIIEKFYIKMELWKKNCLKDKNMKAKYDKLKAQKEKEMKYLKCEQNLMEEKMIEMKKISKIINKNNKIIVLRNKKYDPFYKKYIEDEVNKKRIKSKENDDKLKLENTYEKYNYYLYY